MAVVVVIGRQCPIKYTIRWSFHFLFSYIKKIYWSIIISVQMLNFSLAFWYEFWKYILYYQEIAGNICSKESIFSGTPYSLLQYDLMIKPEIMVIWTKNHLLLCVLLYNCTCLSFLCVPFSCPAKRAALLFFNILPEDSCIRLLHYAQFCVFTLIYLMPSSVVISTNILRSKDISRIENSNIFWCIGPIYHTKDWIF